MVESRQCPHCGEVIEVYRNPIPTVDGLILMPSSEGDGIVLVERKNPPFGWALPGGFVDYGESCETAVVREMKEETGLDVDIAGLFNVYSDPDRDERHHTMSVVYICVPRDPSMLAAGDDAARAEVFPLEKCPDLAFDHGRIVHDFIVSLSQKRDGLHVDVPVSRA
ncbi:NUDIX domain-containing protein [Pseudodesulfovibrio sp. JC047]|uniref:NUDIX domain-containing protein n=1 Tax=Pseudodesulfovibrio sp. JC047 TaxID=2683199 RepID=UPI0013D41218|nr:NUDIX hydrolase [Pseudodesulfovibrio sp. JC047]NDV17978.1 NUDIX domain-containing protein [Pseudodesulfovibrio sp. JC047]